MAETVSGTFEPAGQHRGGHLRSAEANYRIDPKDVFVPEKIVAALRLRGGETLTGTAISSPSPANNGNGKYQKRNGHRPNNSKPNSSGIHLVEVLSINGLTPGEFSELKPFDELTAIDPQVPVRFETKGGPTSMRVIDLMTPIGLGQRGLIVAPPRTGKTVMLQQMAHGIATNHPDVYMMVLLIDERPEEVTDMRRNVNGEVIASSNDENVASHVRIARLMIRKAKRHVETGENVVILLDSLTRLGRAFNVAVRGRGRIMSGGLDVSALLEPKAIFGAARNIEKGGSLTIIASALIDTGSRMDEVIFNEFKGTGNMEIMLSRNLANRRIWPAIELAQSGTRKEELLLSTGALNASHNIRRNIVGRNPERAMEELLDRMGKFESNEDFIADIDRNTVRVRRR